MWLQKTLIDVWLWLLRLATCGTSPNGNIMMATAPDGHTVHLKCLNEFRNALPDSVAKTFPTAVGTITNRQLIECITDTAPLSLLQWMSPGSPIQTDTKTLVSPVESINTHPTSGSHLPVLPFPRGSIDDHKAIPYTCMSRRFNWKHIYPIIGWQDETCWWSNLSCER